ncbi:conserved protein of unknown function [Pseudomonas putida KT2440]|uniref:RHS protein conserved region domain-containing protein n=1 Tax=Pseudomonas putida (strain ATCC 47054 / DSM 6125 / CFBP 8728 / NCIMB 11950 / KT2440) TaxID=160488 RepID=Q88I90_PSEPK|nr:conserved protein of unknown function [Pseudomonas putida KT2440]
MRAWNLPDGRKVNQPYYGSGHLHQLNLDGQVTVTWSATTCTGRCTCPSRVAMRRWRGLIRLKGEGQKVYYFHTGQVGTPLELTDRDGTIVKGSILIVKSILTIILFFIMVLKLRCSLLRNQLGLKAVVIFINMGRNPLGVLIR